MGGGGGGLRSDRNAIRIATLLYADYNHFYLQPRKKLPGTSTREPDERGESISISYSCADPVVLTQ